MVKLTREGPVPPISPEASVVLFPDGDRLYRTAIGAATDTALDVQSFSLGHLNVPLDSLLGLVLALPTDSDALDGLLLKVRDEPRKKESVWLSNGDQLTGGFLALSDRELEFQTDRDKLKLERTGVSAIGFDPAHVSYPKPAAAFYEVTLSDGSRIGVSGARIVQGSIEATTRFGVGVKIAVGEILRLSARTSKIVYLSERSPAGVRYVPYVGPVRPWRRDVSVEGHPMRIAARDFEHGIGTQSRTLLAYRLDPGDLRFQAEVGVDDRAGPLGSVVFRVLLDNREVFASPPLSARDAPRLITVDVKGAKALILLTEFGEHGGVRDFADWGDARIIR